jgi:outer membrane protein assembly factor BamD (BamD/ComL family)
MKFSLRGFLSAVAFLSLSVPPAHSQNPELAKDLAEEGVTNEAKIEFVRVLHDSSKKAAYAEAHYYLGQISFREKKYDRAVFHWNILVKQYPDSSYVKKAREQIRIAYALLSRETELFGESLEIGNLFQNAEFLVGQPMRVSIDTSFLPKGDLAIECLEEVVKRFPDSPDAPRALFREALIYYGWGKNGIGQYSSPEGYGFTFHQYYKPDARQVQFYIGKIIAALEQLEKQYPDSFYKVPVAFLAGQAYWAAAGGKTDLDARTYWGKVLNWTQNDTASTYRQIAEKRLK